MAAFPKRKKSLLSFLRGLCRGHREQQQPQGPAQKLDSPGSWVCRSSGEEMCHFLHASRIFEHSHETHGAILLALFGCPNKESQPREARTSRAPVATAVWMAAGGRGMAAVRTRGQSQWAGEEEPGLLWAGGWVAQEVSGSPASSYLRRRDTSSTQARAEPA